MRYTKQTLETLKIKIDKDFYDYINDYITQIEAFGHEFESVEISEEKNEAETFVYYFKYNNETFETKEEIELFTRDDDSQPNNSYSIYFGSLTIYETRYT